MEDRRSTWGAGKRNFTSLFLEPLGPPAMETLLRGPVPGLPDELRDRILERAEGVPFYAVETVRMLMDRGLLIREGSSFRVSGPIETLEVPETLQALIAARLDGLADGERRLLQQASILGRTFTVPGLSAVTGLPEADLQPRLASLVHKDVLTISADPSSPERGQYGFLQDLVKKVAYDTMSRKERRSLHIAAAEFLERGFGSEEDEIIEVVAAHYLDAYRAAPDAPDAGEIRDRARDRLVRAADRASSLGASLEAQRYFERAVELADDPMTRADLSERAGMTANAGARPVEASAHFTRAMELFEANGATHAAARVSARLAEDLWDRGRLEEGLANMDRAFEVLSDEEPDEDFAWLAAQLGRFRYFEGDTDAAAERIEVALGIAEELGLPEILSQALNTKSLVLATIGRRHEAGALLRFALEVALDNDKPTAALRAHNNLIDLATADDRYGEAVEHRQHGLALARRVGNRRWEHIFLGYFYPLYALGRWDDALASIGELPVDDREDRVAFNQGYVAFSTALHVHRGEPDEAEAVVARFAEFQNSPDWQERAEHACARAWLALGRGDARGAFREAAPLLDVDDPLALWHHAMKEALVVGIDAAIMCGDLDAAQEVLDRIAALSPARRPQFLDAHALRLGARLATARRDEDAVGARLQGVRRAVPRDRAAVLAGRDASRARRVARRAGPSGGGRAAARRGPVDLRAARGGSVAPADRRRHRVGGSGTAALTGGCLRSGPRQYISCHGLRPDTGAAGLPGGGTGVCRAGDRAARRRDGRTRRAPHGHRQADGGAGAVRAPVPRGVRRAGQRLPDARASPSRSWPASTRRSPSRWRPASGSAPTRSTSSEPRSRSSGGSSPWHGARSSVRSD